MSLHDLPTHYNPKEFEEQLYQHWEEQGYFQPESRPNLGDNANVFSIVIPPPNVTGSLHIGHALDTTLQDILIRWHRMLQDKTLWLTGTDHAGIATQAIVERNLASEGQNRHELGREAFIEKTWEWAKYSQDNIWRQFRKLGISPDLSRMRFTLDDGCSKAVRKAFVSMYDSGLIYQGDYIVNWSPGLQSAISDIETEYSDDESFLWHIFYPLAEDPTKGLTVATTRPETMFGDVAVAVHPDDERYQAFIGKTVKLPLTNIEIPVIADTYVEKDFGTGALKITPAHDPNDFEVGQRHHLTPVLIMNERAELLSIDRVPKSLQGLNPQEARKQTEKQLEFGGFLKQKEPHTLRVGRCQRSGTIVEPMLSKQWFVKTQPMAQQCLTALHNGEIQFIPERWTKVYTDWMENIRDWCISRQLWWGHQIPAWHCKNCKHITVSEADPTECENCKQTGELIQDPDVLDTWFSSGLWPFSTMGWPDTEKPDYKTFYPTSVLVTGFDIIFFWVARMTMMGHQLTGQSPFKTVYIHGLVRDEHGQKMSKSKGNVLDPVEIINEYGCDALRYALTSLVTYGGQDIKLSKDRFEQGRLFCNKLWNASRFVLMNLEGVDQQFPEVKSMTPIDHWLLASLSETIGEANKLLKEFKTGEYVQLVSDFIWSTFCDWYVEAAKMGLKNAETRLTTQRCLRLALESILRLLHPAMPFITEAIWQKLPFHQEPTIMHAAFPKQDALPAFDRIIANDIPLVLDAIRCIRNTRQTSNIQPSIKTPVIIETAEPTELAAYQNNENLFYHFLKLECLEIKTTASQLPSNTAIGVIGKSKIYVEIVSGLSVEEERERQQKKRDKLLSERQVILELLSKPGFTDKAPIAVVEKNRVKCDELTQQIQTIETQLKTLG